MIYKIIFSITIFILNFLIIKDEIPNYSKEAKIMLLILLLLWFPAFLMEAKIAVNVMMITMLMCIGSSEISVFKIFNTDTFKIIFLLFLFVQCWEMASMLFFKRNNERHMDFAKKHFIFIFVTNFTIINCDYLILNTL